MDGPFAANRVWCEEGSLTWEELARRGAARLAGVPGAGVAAPVAWLVESSLEAMEVAAAAFRDRLDLAIIERGRMSEGVAVAVAAAGMAVHPGPPGTTAAGAVQPGRIRILTSGSTGTPKLLEHTWASLLTVGGALPPRRWLLPFQPGSYAWFQLVAPALAIPGQELVLAPPGDVREALAAARRHGADAISSTPTFWRVALMTVPPEELSGLAFRQITLGGELVDQAILDELARRFPAARLVHIFAATEVGACIVVKDGLAGFPAEALERADAAAALRIVEGHLQVRSARRAGNVAVDADGWVDTGDLVERVGGRVHFKGRAGRQLINVGGQKAYPADVEAVLLGHPSVRWCRVEARRAPLMGSLVAARLVTGGAAGPDLERQLTDHCRARLPEYAVPRFFEFLAAIPVGGNLKSAL